MIVRSVSLFLLVTAFLCTATSAAEELARKSSQTVYVPVYSHVYGGPKSHQLNLTTTLMVRNTDPANTIEVLSIAYHDSSGRLVKEFLKQPLLLSALSSKHVIVEEHDVTGGPGPSFLVRWSSTKPVNQPLIEGIMITTRSGLGISFVTQGVPVAVQSP